MIRNMPKTCSRVHVKRSEKSVQELWLPKSPTFSSVWMNRYQFTTKSLSAPRKVQPPTDLILPESPLPAFSTFGLRKLMTAPCESHPLYLTDNSSLDGRSVRRTICMTQHWNVSRFDAKLEITVSEYSILRQN